jgi:hypothetical protein
MIAGKKSPAGTLIPKVVIVNRNHTPIKARDSGMFIMTALLSKTLI